MMLSMAEKIRIVLNRKGMSLGELADELGMSRQNLNNKMQRDNWREKELIKIAKAMGVRYEANFLYEDGTKI